MKKIYIYLIMILSLTSCSQSKANEKNSDLFFNINFEKKFNSPKFKYSTGKNYIAYSKNIDNENLDYLTVYVDSNDKIKRIVAGRKYSHGESPNNDFIQLLQIITDKYGNPVCNKKSSFGSQNCYINYHKYKIEISMISLGGGVLSLMINKRKLSERP